MCPRSRVRAFYGPRKCYCNDVNQWGFSAQYNFSTANECYDKLPINRFKTALKCYNRGNLRYHVNIYDIFLNIFLNLNFVCFKIEFLHTLCYYILAFIVIIRVIEKNRTTTSLFLVHQ